MINSADLDNQPPRPDPSCAFCRIFTREAPGRVLLRTNDAVAFLPDEPATQGHCLVSPVTHIRDVWELDEATSISLARMTLHLAKAVRAAFHPEGLNIIQSNGEAATQTVMHLHVHVVPRWTSDSIRDFWPTTTWSEEQLNKTQDAIIERL